MFPLLRQRWRFAGWQGFRLLDATDGGGEVPDVFAYANRAHLGPADADERRSLVVYLNRYPGAHVRILGVAEALGLGDDPAGYLILRDQRSGLEYLRQVRDLRERGLELALDGYASHVFLGFEEVSDADGAAWAELARQLGLAGVEDAHAALRWLRDRPLRDAVAGLFATPTAQAGFLPPAVASDETTVAGTGRAARGPRGSAGTALPSSPAPPPTWTSWLRGTASWVDAARAVRPRLLAQCVAASILFMPVARAGLWR